MYIQSGENILRKIYFRPVSELNLSPDKFLELIKSFYGFPDTNDCWNRKMALHIENDSEMSKSNNDNALCSKRNNKDLTGILGQYVDDSFQSRTDDFLNSTNTSLKTFVSKARKFNTFNFCVICISNRESNIYLNKTRYISSLLLRF